MDSLYLRIKEKTDASGLSGKELGILLGLKKSPLTDWKNGKSSPTVEQLKKMCDIFAVSSDYLLFGKSTLAIGNLEITDAEHDLMIFYRDMNSEDQKELLMIAEMKYRKEKKNQDAKSSLSNDEKLA